MKTIKDRSKSQKIQEALESLEESLLYEFLWQVIVDENIEKLKSAINIGVLINKIGSVINKIGPEDYTPLGFASAIGSIDILKQLLKVPDIRIDERGKTGLTPLMHTVESTEVEAVKLLIEHEADVSLRTPNGKTITEFAEFIEENSGAPNFADNVKQLIIQSKKRV